MLYNIIYLSIYKPRLIDIVKKLYTDHRVDISKDVNYINLVMLKIMATNRSNEDIIKSFLEMYVKEKSSKIS